VVLSSQCVVCGVALRGWVGRVLRIAGIRRSAQNPNLCNRCDAHIEDGRVADLAVFFADLTGYTQLTHTQGPQRTHEILDRFLRRATESIVKWDGFVTQFVGDEVMAFFNVPLAREDYTARAVAAASDLLAQMPAIGEPFGLAVEATIGIAAGHARIGLVGTEQIRNYSAIGDVVNRAARLVARVEPGGVLVDERVYADVARDFPNAKCEQVALKGFEEPVKVALLHGRIALPAVTPAALPTKRPIRFATAIAAVLGAPCAGFVALNALGLAVGASSLGLAAVGPFLEQNFVKLPLLALATAGATANLVAVASGRAAARSSASGTPLTPRRSERRRTVAGIALSIVALGFVGFELIAHALLH
jgi:adenylate cyclase